MNETSRLGNLVNWLIFGVGITLLLVMVKMALIWSGSNDPNISSSFIDIVSLAGENGELFIVAVGISANAIGFVFKEKVAPDWAVLLSFGFTILVMLFCFGIYIGIVVDPTIFSEKLGNISVLSLLATIISSGFAVGCTQ